jgi:hypothetical protein
MEASTPRAFLTVPRPRFCGSAMGLRATAADSAPSAVRDASFVKTERIRKVVSKMTVTPKADVFQMIGVPL